MHRSESILYGEDVRAEIIEIDLSGGLLPKPLKERLSSRSSLNGD